MIVLSSAVVADCTTGRCTPVPSLRSRPRRSTCRRARHCYHRYRHRRGFILSEMWQETLPRAHTHPERAIHKERRTVDVHNLSEDAPTPLRRPGAGEDEPLGERDVIVRRGGESHGRDAHILGEVCLPKHMVRLDTRSPGVPSSSSRSSVSSQESPYIYSFTRCMGTSAA
jgi:hypothetical protein